MKGMGFCSTLTIVFIVLKLCGVISWSWLWVLAPLWISWGIIGLIIAMAAIKEWYENKDFNKALREYEKKKSGGSQ